MRRWKLTEFTEIIHGITSSVNLEMVDDMPRWVQLTVHYGNTNKSYKGFPSTGPLLTGGIRTSRVRLGSSDTIQCVELIVSLYVPIEDPWSWRNYFNLHSEGNKNTISYPFKD